MADDLKVCKNSHNDMDRHFVSAFITVMMYISFMISLLGVFILASINENARNVLLSAHLGVLAMYSGVFFFVVGKILHHRVTCEITS